MLAFEPLPVFVPGPLLVPVLGLAPMPLYVHVRAVLVVVVAAGFYLGWDLGSCTYQYRSLSILVQVSICMFISLRIPT